MELHVLSMDSRPLLVEKSISHMVWLDYQGSTTKLHAVWPTCPYWLLIESFEAGKTFVVPSPAIGPFLHWNSGGYTSLWYSKRLSWRCQELLHRSAIQTAEQVDEPGIAQLLPVVQQSSVHCRTFCIVKKSPIYFSFIHLSILQCVSYVYSSKQVPQLETLEVFLSIKRFGHDQVLRATIEMYFMFEPSR